jgi:hypothetical protein
MIGYTIGKGNRLSLTDFRYNSSKKKDFRYTSFSQLFDIKNKYKSIVSHYTRKLKSCRSGLPKEDPRYKGSSVHFSKKIPRKFKAAQYPAERCITVSVDNWQSWEATIGGMHHPKKTAIKKIINRSLQKKVLPMPNLSSKQGYKENNRVRLVRNY